MFVHKDIIIVFLFIFFVNLAILVLIISDLKKNSLKDIQQISENIASNIIESISGDKLNGSSIKATVEDISKKNLGKYL